MVVDGYAITVKSDSENLGDIGWNNFSGGFVIYKDGLTLFMCKIQPFTDNCGIKAVKQVYFVKPNVPVFKMVELLEQFLVQACNVAIVAGSGYAYTVMDLQKKWPGIICTPPVHNPNYMSKHEIILWYKVLQPLEKPNPWFPR